ncbi:MAG TPA: hypothetical protein DCL29_02150 [Eubacterium sp.]|nr:hypothetical protein [Eubacterium sp.]
MPTEKELMLKQADAEATYQKKLTAGQNITINPVTNEISSSGGGSNVEYTSNFATGETLGLISINGEVTPIKTPNLVSGTNITIETDVTTGAKTISSTASGGSDVEITPALSSGTKIADFEIDGLSGALYAPSGGSTVTPNPTGTPTDTMNTVEVDGIIYNLPSGGGGSSAIEKTLSEYKALTPAQKTNGSIYMVQGRGSSEDSFDMTQGSAYKQDSMSFTASETNIESFWNGGTTIGGDWRTIAIDVTDLITIKFNIQTTTCYAHNNSNVEEQTNARFVNTVYLFTSIPSGWSYDSESQAIDYLKFKYTNTNYGEQEFDVSELTGSLYIVWASSGWNAIMSDLTFVSKSSDNKIYFMNTEYANTNGGGGGSNVSITPSLPRGTKIADYSIDGVSNELLAPIVNILQEDYDALPSTKNSDGIVYFITATKELDSNYTYHKYGENDEIVVRVYHEGEADEEIIWFFNGFTKTASEWSVPSELQPYTPDVSTLGSTTSKTYDTSDSDTHTGWIGWSRSLGRNVIRSWTVDWNMTLAGTFYAVVKADDGDEQTNLYEDPYVWVESTSRKIMLNGRAFVNTGGGGSSVIPNPTDPATDTLNTIEIDNIVYDLPGGGSGSANFIGLPASDYTLLPIAEKEDQTKMYMVTADEDITPVDMYTGATKFVESDATLTFDSTTQTTLGYTSGGYIGQCCYYAPVDLTDVETIKYELVTGETYGSKMSQHNDLRNLGIGIKDTAPTGFTYHSSIGYTKYNQYHDINDANKTFTEEEIDVSMYTGTYYIVVTACGWNMVLSNIRLCSAGQGGRTIYWNNETWSGGGGGGGSANLIDLTQEKYNNLPISERTNGSAYFINEQESGGTTTRQLSVTFANAELKWEVGENFLSAEGQTTHDSRYSCKVEVVDSTTVRYTRTFNGNPENWYTGNYYDGQYITFTAGFVTSYMGTSTVDFECVYDIPAYEGTKIYHNDIEFKNIGVNELTQAEYNNLPLAKRQNGNIYMTHDGGYTFVNYNDGKIIVRANSDKSEILWFFNGYTKTTEDDVIPEELLPYVPTKSYTGSYMRSYAWTDANNTARNGRIGFVYPADPSRQKIRSWTDAGDYLGGTFWGVVLIDGAQEQTTEYYSPTEGLQIVPNRIYYNNTLYADVGGSSETKPSDSQISLFENGQWLNQNLVTITSYNGTIVDNELHCQGSHAGIVTSNLSGLSNYIDYSITIKGYSNSGISYQTGTCIPTTDLNAIIAAGANRDKYINKTDYPSGEFEITLHPNLPERGVFFGGDYNISTTDYYITEVLLNKLNTYNF